jgi:pimeloyl-ACP methyl ester carboxylesterase
VKREVGTLASTNLTSIFRNGGWQSAGEIADFCATQASDTDSLIGTAFVARDMMQIVDALGEDGMLRYYGWSYGTALGSYAAAMFPDRIGSMVLDANVNPYDYQAGHYNDHFIDTDSTFAAFINTCFDAQDDCSLYAQLQPDSAQDILDAINLALAPLARNATTGAAAYQTYLTIKAEFLQPLYFPNTWPDFADTIASLLNGSAANAAPAPPAETYGSAENALLGIRSSDATFIANTSADYVDQMQYQATISPGFSDIAYYALWISAQWQIPAKERYWGDFNVKTKNPILYVNGEFDPVTPLKAAYNGSAGFEGSVVLAHSGYGHGVFADPSDCVARHVQAYLKEGTLPANGTTCEPNQSLLQIWRATVREDATSTNSSSGGNGNESAPTPSSSNAAAATDAATRGEINVMLALGMGLVGIAASVL